MSGLLIGLLLVLLIGSVISLLLLREWALKPLNELKELVADLDVMDAAELKTRAARISGIPGEAARAFAASLESSEGPAVRRGAPAAAPEESDRQSVVDEICGALLPQPLKHHGAAQPFSLTGGIRQGTRKSCAFYDHFFLDEHTLCFAVGQVPGGGIAEALFAVIAQTMVRSRIRLGRSLTETMSDVNAQLFDLGGRNSVQAIVCVLNTVSGELSFVNAGGALPALMRREERYEWLKAPIYAPLGANESVCYRSEALRLGQGDRLFLYTADFGEITNREGERFCESRFLSALNRSRGKAGGTAELLRAVQDEAAAFCESEAAVLSSAAIALEYQKGSRDFVFTTVQASPEAAPAVTAFIQKTLEEGKIPRKESARQLLLADELFALCCRACGDDAAQVRVECAIQTEERAIHLRLFAPMGGSDPLRAAADTAGGTAADYIRAHTRRASFEAGNDRDLLEIVSDLP